MNAETRVRAGSANLAREERRAWGVALASTLLSLAVLFFLSGRPKAGALGLLVCVAAFAAFQAYQTRYARQRLRDGCREVLAVGWTRYPDGCNYAVFGPGADPGIAEPELVVRLHTRRRTRTSPAFLCGRTTPSRWRSVALLDPDGEVLGVGRVRPTASAEKVWRRRHSP
jgi:hypothetical protein